MWSQCKQVIFPPHWLPRPVVPLFSPPICLVPVSSSHTVCSKTLRASPTNCMLRLIRCEARFFRCASMQGQKKVLDDGLAPLASTREAGSMRLEKGGCNLLCNGSQHIIKCLLAADSGSTTGCGGLRPSLELSWLPSCMPSTSCQKISSRSSEQTPE